MEKRRYGEREKGEGEGKTGRTLELVGGGQGRILYRVWIAETFLQ